MTRLRAITAALWPVLAAACLIAQAGVSSALSNPLANPGANRPLPAFADNTGACTTATGGAWHCQSPCFPTGALVYNSSRPCTALLLKAINAAQASEHLNGFSLPSNYYRLNVTQQMFVLINLERISRSVPPLAGLSPYLTAEATTAARQAADPIFQPSYGPVHVWLPPAGGYYAFGAVWAGDSVNAASALFGWFYDDGWGGKGSTWNFACTGPGASGCWGHRDELMGKWAGTACTDCIAGGGYVSPAANNWRESYTFLIIRPTEFPTPMGFTWDKDVIPYLPAGWERAPAPAG